LQGNNAYASLDHLQDKTKWDQEVDELLLSESNDEE